ncbi:MAG: serine/threonine-protein kinase [Actinomycetota bacterium]
MSDARIGPYRVGSLIGQGAVAEVYEAMRELDGLRVALKVLRPELASDPTYVARFEHEARSAREVQHRHLVSVLDAGEADGLLWLACELVSGRTLEEWIHADGKLSISDAIRIAGDVGAGLDALHRAGLVHRDVKPANIVLDAEGSARLADFGLAKGEAYTVLTRTGQLVGTLDYVAPELVLGKRATRSSDIYGLGCVVYGCLAGGPPFRGLGMLEAARAIVNDDPPDPFVGRADGSATLSWAVLRAFAKDPAERPPTGTTYAHMLRLASKE